MLKITSDGRKLGLDQRIVDVYKRQAVRRAVLGSKDMELIRLYSDVPEFRQRLHREVIIPGGLWLQCLSAPCLSAMIFLISSSPSSLL